MNGQSLLCSVGTRVYAVPIEHVVETMRPLAIEPIAGAPTFVSGLSVVRGVPLPVVSVAQLLEQTTTSPPGRFVTLRNGAGFVVLAVDAVIGVRRLPPEASRDLPPLLREAAADVVAKIGTLDAQLLLVLRTLQLLPESFAGTFAALVSTRTE